MYQACCDQFADQGQAREALAAALEGLARKTHWSIDQVEDAIYNDFLEYRDEKRRKGRG